MTQMPGYPYSPLEGSDGIRLLTIEAVDPEEECAEIRCKIEKFRLESAPPYRALSYAWGHTNSKAIILDGSRVKIRENLWHALWNLRDRGFSVPNLTTRYHFTKGDTKWIWIDALCIDQRNTAERNHQVRLMGQIYKTAVEVVAWLGCLKEKSNNGRDFYDVYAWMIGLNKLAEETQLGDGDYYLAGTHLLPEFNPITVLQFFDRPYWRRMWIVQEIGLASDITILFDDLSANWKGLHRLRMLLSSPSLAPAPAFTARFQLLRTNEKVQGSQAFSLDRHRTSQQSNKLEDLIETCQDSICSDPRDKVYALLGLAVDCQNDELAVDYSKTLFQIYADVINFYHPSHSREGGPSQHTVRFSQMLQRSFDRPSELRDGADRYLLAPDSELSLSAINIFGICTSIISGLGQACNSATILLQLSKLPPHHIDARSRENMSRTIEDMRKVIPISSQTSFALQAQNATRFLVSINTSATPSSKQIKKSHSTQESQNCLPFVMDNGQTGYVPMNARIGDSICQFLGCDVAAVLRERPGGYDIVGRALVDKSVAELQGNAESWTKKYSYSVPDFGSTFTWTPEQAMYLYLDMATLQQLTA